MRLDQDLRKVKKHPLNLCIQRLDSFDDARPRFLCVTRFPPSEHLALHLNAWISLSQRQ